MQTVYYKDKVVGVYHDDLKLIEFDKTPEGKEAEAELLKGYSVYVSSRGTGHVDKQGFVVNDQYPRTMEIRQYSC